ncbi:MAG: hypothetical protein Q7R99_02400 [bacterium]|nr:hypothetical protein [bacterium]
MNRKDILKKIFVAPHFFIYHEYFDMMQKFFENQTSKEVKQIKTKYGKNCLKRISKGEIPISKEEELRKEQVLSAKQFKRWNERETDCFLAYVELNDVASKSKAFYNSFIIFLFADFENILDDVCNQYFIKNNPVVSLKDVVGKGIERSLKYLEKVAGFDMPKDRLYSDLVLIRDIRNCLVHAGGETTDHSLIRRIKDSKYIFTFKCEYSSNQIIGFKREYCKYAVNLIENYLSLNSSLKPNTWRYRISPYEQAKNRK